MTLSATDGRLLSGSRGWSVVTVLTLVLGMLLMTQAAATSARAGDLAAPAALPVADRVALVEGERLPSTDVPAAVEAPGEATVPAAVEVPVAPAVEQPVTVAEEPPAADLCSGPGWEQRRGEAALASLAAGAERTGFSIAFVPARQGYMGLTHLHERRIEVFVRDCGTQSDALLRHVVAHELGHAYDTAHLTAELRAAWQQARGIPASTDWYGCSGCADFATPAGDFAEVYAQWLRGAGDNRSELAGAPGPDQLAELARRFFGA